MPVVIDGVRNATGGIRVEKVDVRLDADGLDSVFVPVMPVVLEIGRRHFPSACEAFELGGGSIVD